MIIWQQWVHYCLFYLLAEIKDSLPELNLLFSEAIDAVIDWIVGQAPLLGIMNPIAVISSCKN